MYCFHKWDVVLIYLCLWQTQKLINKSLLNLGERKKFFLHAQFLVKFVMLPAQSHWQIDFLACLPAQARSCRSHIGMCVCVCVCVCVCLYIYSYLCFRLALLHSVSYFFSLHGSPSSALGMVFDSISSNIDQVLSINPCANVFVFGDFKGRVRYICASLFFKSKRKCLSN